MTTEKELAELYVAVLGRAPDAAGLAFWVTVAEQGATLEEICADWFSNQAEVTGKYEGLDTEGFISAAYKNAFGRSPDESGLTFWGSLVENGVIGREGLLNAIMQGAKAPTGGATDAAMLTNRAEIGVEFAKIGITVATLAADIIKLATPDPASISLATAVLELIPVAVASGQPSAATNIVTLIDNLATTISSNPSATAGLATYVSEVSAKIASAPSATVASVIAATASIAREVVADPTLLENAAGLAQNTVVNPGSQAVRTPANSGASGALTDFPGDSGVTTSAAPAPRITSTAGPTINELELSHGLARLNGQTEPFTQIQIKLAPSLTKTIYAHGSGHWNYALTSADIDAMGEGLREISSWTVDEAGNRSTPSTLTLLIDTISPATFTPRLIDESNTGSKLDQISSDTTPTFNISAELGAKIEVQDTVGSYKLIGIGTGAAQDYTVTLNALPGLHKLNFLVTDAAGNTQTATFDYTLDIGEFSNNLGNPIVLTRPTQLPPPSFISGAPIATELLNGVMETVRIVLAKLPFVADFAGIASFIQSHLTLDLDLTSKTFQIGYDNDSSVLTVPLSLNLGFPGLSFDVSGNDNFDITLTCTVNISGGYDDANNTVYLDTSANSVPSISITANASLPEDLALKGTLGALSVSGTNNETHADVTASLSLTNQAADFTLEEILQYVTYLASSRDSSQRGSLTDEQIADLDILNEVEPEMFDATSYISYLGNIVNTVNSRLSNRDDKLTWSELEHVFLNPTSIGSIISATAVANQNISFTVVSDVDTGASLIDTFIPNFSFIASAMARQQGDLNSGSLSYTADVALTDTRITSDILKDVVKPFMRTGDKILSPLYPLVDFFYAPLPWKVQLYESTVPLPSGWSTVNPVAWYEYIKGQAKEGLSSGIDGLITGAYSMMDLNRDSQVQVIEILQAPVKLGQLVSQAGLEIVAYLEATIEYIRDNPQKSGLEYGTVLGAIAGQIGGAAGAAGGAVVGGSLGMAVAIYIAENASSLLEKTNKLENDLINLQQLMGNLDRALNHLETLLLKVKQFEELTQQFESNEVNGAGITMSGIELGDYEYRIVDGHYTLPNDNNTSGSSLLTYVNQASSSPASNSVPITGPLAELLNNLAGLGVELPILTDRNILGKVFTLQPVDLITYDPDLPNVILDFSSDFDPVAVGQEVANLLQVVGLPDAGDAYAKATELVSIFANLQTKFFGSLTIEPNIDFGVDTGGLNSWLTHGMPLDYSGLLNLADGFYISDHLTAGSVDNPELTVNAAFGMQNIVSLGWPFVGAEMDVTTQLLGQLLFDINDPNQDGKMRLSEIIGNIQTNQDLMEVVSPSYLDFNVSGEGSAWLDFTKPIPIDALKSLGFDNGLATAILKVTDWVTGAAENRYSLDIPFDATWRLLGTTDNSIFQV